MSKFYGIDLGTTFSAISYLDDLGKPQICPMPEGESITHSCVTFSEGTVYVGSAAYSMSTDLDHKENSVRAIKRHMDDENYKVSILGKDYTPTDISAFILKKIADGATKNTGEECKKVVISIPANFSEQARKATMDAGKIAGLEVMGLINEPSAAALYYSQMEKVSGRTVIFDLGGGTFDVTIGDINGSDVKIKTSSGNRDLGGVNFDRAIVDIMKEKYKEKFNEELYEGADLGWEEEDRKGGIINQAAENDALNTAEEAKITLSKLEKCTIKFEPEKLDGSDGERLKFNLTREEFEASISSYIANIEMLIEGALSDISCSVKDIKNVILVGGSSRIPAVQKLLESTFGYPPTQVGSLDECVSRGAAIYAGVLVSSGDTGDVDVSEEDKKKINNTDVGDIVFKDVCQHYYGTIAIINGVSENVTIIKKDQEIPCSVTELFSTMSDNQKGIEISITQFELESKDINEVNIIAKERMPLPPGTRGGSSITVTYAYDKNQRLQATIEHVDSGTKLLLNGDTSKENDFTSEVIEEKKDDLSDFEID